MERPITFLLSLLLCSAALGQHEADKWYFTSQGDGLDFTGTCDPTVLSDGMISGEEGCSTISDPATGELLFYTNSGNIWNRDHELMPNSDLIPNGATISQVLIIPRPGSTTQYYLFTGDRQLQTSFGYRFSCIDMALNNGLGGLLYKDSVAFPGPVTEKLVAIRHDNNEDIWVIGHDSGNDRFLAFRVTSAGVSLQPVVSVIGKVYTSDAAHLDYLGEIKASPYRDRIAVTTVWQPNIELFHFDASTGVISDLAVLDAPGGYDGANSHSWWYGVSFSPDGSKLYAARPNYVVPVGIQQWDVSSDDEAIMNGTTAIVSALDGCYDMKLAPNGRIYVRRSGNFLGAIAFPDSAGSACGFDAQSVDFGHECFPPGTCWGLQNLMEFQDYPCKDISTNVWDAWETPPALFAAPNPCQDVVTLQFPRPLSRPAVLECINDLGQVSKRIPIAAHTSTMDVPTDDLVAGPYLLRLTHSGNTASHLVVEH